ncbi:phospholipid-binding protein MlaC [Streptomyces sp. TLI_146]|uniref:MlaC/ttg2D family ABC transporter substrate-binding protein n=1 Tax=Streptomyces sp. TLI_146 TaxID=1938858 RepID=UPI000C707BEE|nr:ABC transporter substrate-binding protein [Streptomyces sp. TLI_146]
MAGRHWNAATRSQQEQLIDQVSRLLVHTYARAVAQQLPDPSPSQYRPFRMGPGDTDVVVGTVVMANSQPMQIAYRLYKTAQGWLVYDLNTEGAWLVQTYQQVFNEKVTHDGVDGLISYLTERNDALAGQGETLQPLACPVARDGLPPTGQCLGAEPRPGARGKRRPGPGNGKGRGVQ